MSTKLDKSCSPGWRMTRRYISIVLFASAAIAIALAGCTQCGWRSRSQPAKSAKNQEREDKIRDTVADVTQRAKPTLQKAGKELGEAARILAQGAESAAEGAREGWNRPESRLLNLNSASERELLSLPGVTRRETQRIIQNRPYRNKHELVTKGILAEARYEKIRDRITAR
jgi:DNA uptake protein ComE-like DNA-binding protein